VWQALQVWDFEKVRRTDSKNHDAKQDFGKAGLIKYGIL
jgi:hypothetical protein